LRAALEKRCQAIERVWDRIGRGNADRIETKDLGLFDQRRF
jgi:hypothetical protein